MFLLWFESAVNPKRRGFFCSSAIIFESTHKHRFESHTFFSNIIEEGFFDFFCLDKVVGSVFTYFRLIVFLSDEGLLENA
jgi:hypothetical protein